jgi:hypothetical protein
MSTPYWAVMVQLHHREGATPFSLLNSWAKHSFWPKFAENRCFFEWMNDLRPYIQPHVLLTLPLEAPVGIWHVIINYNPLLQPPPISCDRVSEKVQHLAWSSRPSGFSSCLPLTLLPTNTLPYPFSAHLSLNIYKTATLPTWLSLLSSSWECSLWKCWARSNLCDSKIILSGSSVFPSESSPRI